MLLITKAKQLYIEENIFSPPFLFKIYHIFIEIATIIERLLSEKILVSQF